MAKITKEEAAEILGAKNVRTVERLVSAGKLRAEYEPGKTRRVPMFDADEVRHLAAEQKQPITRAVPADHQQSLVPQIPTNLDNGDRQGNRQMSQFVAFVAGAIERARREAPATSELAHKLMLSLAEAAQLSGLSRNHLRDAIHGKKLKARIIGRGWKVKRSDLDMYVKKL